MAEKPMYLRVRAYLKDFLIGRGKNMRTPILSIIGFIVDDFDISERQAIKYIRSFIKMFTQPQNTSEFEFNIPYVRGTDWGLKQGYLSWKGKREAIKKRDKP